MREKPYYSVRTGRHPTAGRLDWAGLKHLFVSEYHQLACNGYFQQVLGYECVDAGFISGSAGDDIEAFFFRKLRKRDLWPIPVRIDFYTEDDLFDVIELLHDCSSKGDGGYFHSWGECGWHYDSFDTEAGRNDFRIAINDVLREYDSGYELTKQGEVVDLPPAGLGDLERASPPLGDRDSVQMRVTAAVNKFRRRGATLTERRDAVRDLADVLEFLRPKAKPVLSSKDEADLFTLANNFGIRHHNQRQKMKYDQRIWLSWMFYYYLATIHAVTRLIDRSAADDTE